jgi:hypothetical protein
MLPVRLNAGVPMSMTPTQLLARAGQAKGYTPAEWAAIGGWVMPSSRACYDDVLTPEDTRAMIEQHREEHPGWFSGSNTLPVRYASNPPAIAADGAGKEGE